MKVFYFVVFFLVAGVVFYVVLLVLVAGAVPSHGRTESEGTVFNKIHLHESMSSVTVSSSKLETYGFSYLVMQWPMSFCGYLYTINGQYCKQPVPARFTVHGLWPQYNRTHGVDCSRIDGYQRFNIRQLNGRGRLVHDLNYHWPDLKKIVGNNQNFWKNEYNKHGSCTFNDQIRYFTDTLELARNFEDLISRLTGNDGGITLGLPYRSNVIRDAVHRVTTKMPRLHCVPVGGLILLLEIRFCVGRNGLINCRRNTDCWNKEVYLPRP